MLLELYEGRWRFNLRTACGTYSIDVYAIDKSGNVSKTLITSFYYLPIPAVEPTYLHHLCNVSLRVPLTIPGDVTMGQQYRDRP